MNSKKLLFGTALVCAAGSAAFFLLRPKGVVQLTSDPGDAEVYVDGTRMGNTPTESAAVLTLRLNAGEHTLRAVAPEKKPVRWVAEKSIVLAADSVQSVKLSLSEDSIARGEYERELDRAAVARFASKLPALLESMRMVEIKPGTFEMGSPADEPGHCDDETRHTVTLTKPYWLSATEVTQAQYQVVMGENPSTFKGEDSPVEKVSWYDAMKFCARLTEAARAAGRLPAGYEYTLPTEAQWEYACRAGTTGAHAGGLESMAWYDANDSGRTHPVGTKQPNAWGLYDMHGNVCEWCRDWKVDYPSGALSDPAGPSTGAYRVLRGGSRSFSAACCRSAYRSAHSPSARFYVLGFRLALSSVGQAK